MNKIPALSILTPFKGLRMRTAVWGVSNRALAHGGILQHVSGTSRARMLQWSLYDHVIKWKHFPHYWPFMWVIHQPTVNSPHQGQWGGVWWVLFIRAWINGWVNNHQAGYLRRHRAHYDVIVMGTPVTCRAESIRTDIFTFKNRVLNNRNMDYVSKSL